MWCTVIFCMLSREHFSLHGSTRLFLLVQRVILVYSEDNLILLHIRSPLWRERASRPRRFGMPTFFSTSVNLENCKHCVITAILEPSHVNLWTYPPYLFINFFYLSTQAASPLPGISNCLAGLGFQPIEDSHTMAIKAKTDGYLKKSWLSNYSTDPSFDPSKQEVQAPKPTVTKRSWSPSIKDVTDNS